MEKKNQKLIYLFGYSLNNSSQLANVLPLLKAQDSLADITFVLMHDAVVGIVKTKESSANPSPVLSELLSLNIEVQALIPDMKARGINPQNLIEKITPISYDTLADLLAADGKIISWI
ncbi:MAG: DsrH/TusB family sulfur metabolism protein [Promethearchaeota archaeon]